VDDAHQALINHLVTAIIIDTNKGWLQFTWSNAGIVYNWPIAGDEMPAAAAEKARDIFVNEMGYVEVKPISDPDMGTAASSSFSQELTDDMQLNIHIKSVPDGSVTIYDYSHLQPNQVVLAADGCYAQLGVELDEFNRSLRILLKSALGFLKGQEINLNLEYIP